MTKMMTDPKQRQVYDIVENAINALMAVGLRKQGALILLTVQAAIRTETEEDMKEIRKTLDMEIEFRESITEIDDDDDTPRVH